MNNSELVQKLKEQNEKTPIKLYTKDHPQKLGQPNEDQINKAYQKICELWNKTDGSREFVKHLIRGFLPINTGTLVASFTEEQVKNNINRCCILNIRVAGANNIIKSHDEVKAEEALVDKAMTETGRKERTKEEKKRINKLLNKMPIEVRTGTTAYCSATSEKLLSNAAEWALSLFVSDCIRGEEKEKDIAWIIRAKTREEAGLPAKEKKPKQKPIKSTYGMGHFLNEETVKKLKGIK